MSSNPRLEALKMQIRAMEGHAFERHDGAVVPFADPRLNAPLPHHGLQMGALHELCTGGVEAELSPAVTAFAATMAAAILGLRGGIVLWAVSHLDCYIAGLARFGLDPSRIVWVDCRKDTEVLCVMEEALHSRAISVVIGEAGSLSLKIGHRLNAGARASGTTAFLIRRHFHKPLRATETPSGAAATRWRVSSVPSLLGGHTGSGVPVYGMTMPRWRLDLDYCRNGRTASWIVEASDGYTSGKAGDVRVVAELRNDASAAQEAPARQTPRTARAS